MRIFSLVNILLVGVVMATHQGAHLDNLLSPKQAEWLNAGAKAMLTGQIDAPTLGMITKSAQKQAAANIPAAKPNYQPFDFAAESQGATQAEFVPANYSAPANADINGALANVIASLAS